MNVESALRDTVGSLEEIARALAGFAQHEAIPENRPELRRLSKQLDASIARVRVIASNAGNH